MTAEKILSCLAKTMAEVHVWACPQDGTLEQIECYLTNAPPRVCEYIAIQYWHAEVYRVEHSVINNKPRIDVYCDTSNVAKELDPPVAARARSVAGRYRPTA